MEYMEQPKPFTTQLPASLIKRLKKVVKDKGLKMSHAMKLAVEAWVEQQGA